MRITGILLLILSAISLQLNSQSVKLVADLAAGPDNGFRDDALILGTAGNSIAILNGDDIILSDGTNPGTKIIGDLGTGGRVLNSRTVLDGKIYVIIDNNENDYSLVEIDPDKEEMRSLLSGYDYISNLVSYKSKLYCQIDTSSFSVQFVSVDPIDGAIENIFDVDWFGGMRDAIVHKDLIYTIHWKDGADAAYLASTDGTPGQVNEFAFLHSGNDFSQTASINMSSAGDNLYFFYYSPNSDYSLYVSDGTSAGTTVLQDGMERISFYDYDEKRAVGTIGNSIFFRGILEDDFNNQDLWISDGTKQGTCTLRIASDEDEVAPEFFTNYGGKLYFYGYNRNNGWFARQGMIETDGTKNGTIAPYDPNDHEDNLYYTGWQMNSHQDKLFFSAESSDYGSELYSSEGTLESIERVSELAIGDGSSSIRKITSAGENLFFIAYTEAYGRELYVYNSVVSSIDEIRDTPIVISPNPAFNSIQIPELNRTNKQIMIYDQSGRLVNEINNPISNDVSVEYFIPGWYVVKITTEVESFVGRFYKI